MGAKSPLNILDYFLGGYAMAEVFRQQPRTIPGLKEVVEQLATALSGDIIQRAWTTSAAAARPVWQLMEAPLNIFLIKL